MVRHLLVVALDTPRLGEAARWARRLAGVVDGFKVGLELLMAEGPRAVTEVGALGKPVFVDAKLHDIPNTVHGAAVALGRVGARWVTVHASGGVEMMEAAVSGLAEGSGGRAGVLAVTVLTSLDEPGLEAVGVGRSGAEQVAALTALAGSAGVEGVVCPVGETALVRSSHPGLLVATPGIRDPEEEREDQSRVATVEAAVEAGSDLLVVGRPVTRAPDPVATARRLRYRIEKAYREASHQ